jgi:UDP-glucose 4-epimerase
MANSVFLFYNRYTIEIFRNHPYKEKCMAVLVAGGAGYIGSHTVRALQRAGRDVVVFDNFEKGHPEAVLGTQVFKGDLRCPDDLDAVFKQYAIEAVMHFSAYIEVGESMQNPKRYYENNVCGTLNLLHAMQQAGVNHFIFSSTAAVYGEPKYVPIDEKHPTMPTNTYGETKLAVERMLLWFEKAHGLKSIRLRYFNAAGADPGGDIGEIHAPETHLIPIVLSAALGERGAIDVYGTDYDTPDKTCVRDYIHVNDLADAHVLALHYLEAGNPSDVFNLGNGNGYSVRQIIDFARTITGCNIRVNHTGRRPGDPATLIASSGKAVKLLNWQPKLNDIETIIATAWKWHSKTAKTWGP